MADHEESKDDHPGDYLSEGERKKLLVSLHRVLVWVGEKEPQELQIDRAALESEMNKQNDLEAHPGEGDLGRGEGSDRGADRPSGEEREIG
jgi:hypothetical protein